MVSGNGTEITGTTLFPTFGNSCREYSLIAGDFRGRNTDMKWFAGSFVRKKTQRGSELKDGEFLAAN